MNKRASKPLLWLFQKAIIYALIVLLLSPILYGAFVGLFFFLVPQIGAEYLFSRPIEDAYDEGNTYVVAYYTSEQNTGEKYWTVIDDQDAIKRFRKTFVVYHNNSGDDSKADRAFYIFKNGERYTYMNLSYSPYCMIYNDFFIPYMKALSGEEMSQYAMEHGLKKDYWDGTGSNNKMTHPLYRYINDTIILSIAVLILTPIAYCIYIAVFFFFIPCLFEDEKESGYYRPIKDIQKGCNYVIAYEHKILKKKESCWILIDDQRAIQKYKRFFVIYSKDNKATDNLAVYSDRESSPIFSINYTKLFDDLFAPYKKILSQDEFKQYIDKSF